MSRVLTARFMYETNTFSRVPTDMAMIRRRDFHLENEIPAAFRGTHSAFGATFEAADKYGWTLVHPVSANPNPSGTVADDAFEQITGMILDAVDTKGPIDGALLHLHGAMVSDSREDAEGELLAPLSFSIAEVQAHGRRLRDDHEPELVRDVQRLLVAGIVRRAERVRPELPHEQQVPGRQRGRGAAAEDGEVLVPPEAAQPHRLAVEQQLVTGHGDILRPEGPTRYIRKLRTTNNQFLHPTNYQK